MHPHILTCICLLLSAGSHVEASWTYDQESDWGGRCTEGEYQSPVDIDTSSVVTRSVPELIFTKYNEDMESSYINNGHTISIKVFPEHRATISGGDLKSVYILDHIHFHWSAEHTFDGDRLPLEAHFVHYNTMYSNITDALDEWNGLAVIGVVFHEDDDDDPVIDEILDEVKKLISTVNHTDNSMSTESSSSEGATFNPFDLLPNDTDTFYRYHGSLTTPPCHQSVLWTVMKETHPISLGQIEQFRSIKLNHAPNRINYRPVQPLNGRTIELLTGTDESSEENDISDEQDVQRISSNVIYSSATSLFSTSYVLILVIFGILRDQVA